MTPTLSSSGELRSDYDPAALPLIRSMPGARWDPAARCWRVSTRPADRTRVLELADRLGLEVAAELREQAEPPEVLEARARAIAAGAYPYQVDGVAWLASHERALLGDLMGLGKSLQALVALPPAARAIVVAPASVKRVWEAECRRWRPDLTPVVVSGRGGFRLPAPGEVIVVNYDILPAFLTPRPTGELSRGRPAMRAAIPAEVAGVLAESTLIVDEAHFAKNYRTARASKLRELSRACARTWALTGTPLSSRPFDLYGTLDSCSMAREVFSWTAFMRCFGGQKGRWGGYDFAPRPLPEAAERLRRVMLRRGDEVLPQLPPMRWQELAVNGIERADRETLDAAWSEIEALQLPPDELPPVTGFSAARAALARCKTAAALEVVEAHEDAEEPLVLMSCHRSVVDLVGAREGWGHVTGDDSADARAMTVDAFQRRALRGIALTIQAGGVGITLTRAAHVLVVDQPWNPSDLAQAVKRVHRIGQDRPCLIQVLVLDHALDRHVAAVLARKRVLIEGAIEAVAPTPRPRPVVVTADPPAAPALLLSADLPPAGRYCLETREGARNELAFWVVDRPTDPASRWRGWTFLRRQLGPALEPAGAIRPDGSATRADTAAVLRRIAADPLEAMRRYGRELGMCGACGLQLTNDESRSAGIGPICETKLGGAR